MNISNRNEFYLTNLPSNKYKYLKETVGINKIVDLVGEIRYDGYHYILVKGSGKILNIRNGTE